MQYFAHCFLSADRSSCLQQHRVAGVLLQDEEGAGADHLVPEIIVTPPV